MNKLLPIIFFISIISGQLVKFSVDGITGPTLFDLTIFFLSVFGLFQLKGKLTKPNNIVTAALLFCGVCLLSLIFTPLNLSLTEYFVSGSYIARIFIFVLFVWVIFSGGLKTIKQNLINIFFYATLTLAILGLLQLIFIPNLMFLNTYGWDPHYFRTVSTFLDPNFLGAFLVIGLLLLATNQVNTSDNLKKIFFVVIYIAVITTFSRGSALMMVTSFLILSLLLRSLKIFSLTLILSIGFVISFLAYTTYISAPRNIDRTQSASYRIDSWQQGITMFKEYPILGVGFNTYKYALNQFGIANEKFTTTRGATTNDSSLIYVLATTGIIGMAFYLNFLWQILHTSFVNFKHGSILSGVLFSSMFGLIAQSFFSNTLFYPIFMLWILSVVLGKSKYTNQLSNP